MPFLAIKRAVLPLACLACITIGASALAVFADVAPLPADACRECAGAIASITALVSGLAFLRIFFASMTATVRQGIRDHWRNLMRRIGAGHMRGGVLWRS
jgi:hypothetical protein